MTVDGKIGDILTPMKERVCFAPMGIVAVDLAGA